MKVYTYLRYIGPALGLMLIQTVSADVNPWRLDDYLGVYENITISGQHRTRFELLDEQYRGNRNGGDQAMMFRTLVKAEFMLDGIRFAAELQDSRVTYTDTGTPLATTSVNPLELLEAYAQVSLNDLFISGSNSIIKVGRITMDVGSRRLIARNRFRNTINAFTGIDWQWQGPNKDLFRAFYVLPVQRLVNGGTLDNGPKLDKEHVAVGFFGVFYKPEKLPWGDTGEVYLYRLDEEDAPGRATRDRELNTVGFRLFRPPATQRFDYQIESVYQFGESRVSTSSTIDLDHFAHFQHLEIGYTFNAPMSPQLLFQYDYASGDNDPADGENNRFDPLYDGVSRSDFGPTSLYGPFSRSNLSTPGLRLRFRPRSDMTAFVSLRGFWLASSEDAWTKAGINNSPGFSAAFIGTQIEARLRWDMVPENVRVEAGAAHLFAGSLMDNADKSSVSYLYTQIVTWF